MSSSFQLLLLQTVSFKKVAAFSPPLLRPLDLVEGGSFSPYNIAKRHLHLLFVMTHDQELLMDGTPVSFRSASFLQKQEARRQWAWPHVEHFRVCSVFGKKNGWKKKKKKPTNLPSCLIHTEMNKKLLKIFGQ